MHFQRKSRRLIAWTTQHRRAHKKGIKEAEKKRKTRKTVKVNRGVSGMTAEQMEALKNQSTEVCIVTQMAHLPFFFVL